MASCIRTIPFDTWDDFKAGILRELFGADRFDRGRFLFRGQRDATWTLASSFDRAYERLPRGDRAKVATELIAAFKSSLDDHNLGDDLDGNNLVAVAQHHGLPTRLLDWSESPYIAAYFAFTGALMANELTTSVAVWVLDTQAPAWGEEKGVAIVTVSPRGDLRLRNQYGRFTLSKTPFRTLEEHVEYCKDSTALRRIVIPASQGIHAISDLDVMAINSSRLFPDRSGCARNARMAVALKYLTGEGDRAR